MMILRGLVEQYRTKCPANSKSFEVVSAHWRTVAGKMMICLLGVCQKIPQKFRINNGHSFFLQNDQTHEKDALYPQQTSWLVKQISFELEHL